MDRDTVISWAREAGIEAESDTLCRYDGFIEPLSKFAALAYAAGAEAERAEILDKSDDSMSRETAIHLAKCWRAGKMIGGDGYAASVALLDALEAEREACARLVEPSGEHRRQPDSYIGGTEGVELLDKVAATIRARGNGGEI